MFVYWQSPSQRQRLFSSVPSDSLDVSWGSIILNCRKQLFQSDSLKLTMISILSLYDWQPNADSDLVVAHGVAVDEGVELELLLVVEDHLQELPVGVAGVPVSQNLVGQDSREMRTILMLIDNYGSGSGSGSGSGYERFRPPGPQGFALAVLVASLGSPSVAQPANSQLEKS